MSTSERPLVDAADRAAAVDPTRNVVLEASAGTGKTSVLVARYLNLLRAGVPPRHVLAITFTRKAAAEMRERIIAALRREADASPDGRKLWRELRDRTGDISISTIDAFCLALLGEFPLEAGLQPGFRVADETEAVRLVDRAIDEAVSAARGLAMSDPAVALVLVRLAPARLEAGLSALLARRLVARAALARHSGANRSGGRAGRPAGQAIDAALDAFSSGVITIFGARPSGLAGWAADGPTLDPAFRLLARELTALEAGDRRGAADLRHIADLLAGQFFTARRTARQKPPQTKAAWPDEATRARYLKGYRDCAADVHRVVAGLDRAVAGVLAQGMARIAAIALDAYDRALADHDVVDFSEALRRAVDLLGQMDEFAQSRYRLESRHHHVLVDEFQDTNRLQWALVSRLVESWGEGSGLVHDAPLPPSIFLVGDRKQSIYRFRDADVAVIDEAAGEVEQLRPGTEGGVRRYISTSFRSVPALLDFVNALFTTIARPSPRRDAFRFDERDRFPRLAAGDEAPTGEPAVGVIAARDEAAVAARVAAEVARLVGSATVRDRDTGLARTARPGDVAVLFRSRAGLAAIEAAFDALGLPTYVYKGLGFFDTDEVKDVAALLRYLAAPHSPTCAAAFLRSRFVRLSDRAVWELRDDLPGALRDPIPPEAVAALDEDDRRVLQAAREGLRRALPLVDRLPPADLLDRVIDEWAYPYELQGRRLAQARENLKKLRALVRRIQNRGYITLERLAGHIDRLSVGDESNAAVDALDAVNLMTVHAAKGLEFPVVFVVNLARGAGGSPPPVSMVDTGEGPDLVVGAVDDAASDEEQAREVEEGKRLLYVAVTRARDRLYFSTTLTSAGRFQPRRGALGALLPGSFASVFEQAADDHGPATVSWMVDDARRIDLRACRGDAPAAVVAPGGTATSVVRRLGPVGIADEVGPATVIELAVSMAGVRGAARPGSVSQQAPVDAMAGRLVHRLVAAGFGRADRPLPTDAEVAKWITDDEQSAAAAAAVATARRAVARLRRRDEFTTLLASGTVSYEVPFSWQPTAQETGTLLPVGRVRGIIDCLIRQPDGRVIVVEVKTGRRARWHEAQLALYVRAVRATMPGVEVDGRLVYA